jgi:tRNA(adenine34) deaminase
MSDQDFMRAALDLAREAQERGEVPVGAVVVRDGRIIAQGANRNITDNDPAGHAEILALREAGQVLGNHRLTGCSLFVTIEPCAMCAGALVHARLARLIYGASDPKAGAVQSVMQVLNHPALNHRMEVTVGVLAEECSAILQSFFRERRTAKEAK